MKKSWIIAAAIAATVGATGLAAATSQSKQTEASSSNKNSVSLPSEVAPAKKQAVEGKRVQYVLQ